MLHILPGLSGKFVRVLRGRAESNKATPRIDKKTHVLEFQSSFSLSSSSFLCHSIPSYFQLHSLWKHFLTKKHSSGLIAMSHHQTR